MVIHYTFSYFKYKCHINKYNVTNHFCRFYFDITVGNVEIFKKPTILVGYYAKISSIALSPAFNIAVSCDIEGFAIIWDLNDVAYVRSLKPMSFPVIKYIFFNNLYFDPAKLLLLFQINLVSINETLSDI